MGKPELKGLRPLKPIPVALKGSQETSALWSGSQVGQLSVMRAWVWFPRRRVVHSLVQDRWQMCKYLWMKRSQPISSGAVRRGGSSTGEKLEGGLLDVSRIQFMQLLLMKN